MALVLVACEESQRVCTSFREVGHEAYSCDLLPCSGGHPEWHIRVDVREILGMGWDLMIAHPPCTYLCCSGNEWFNEERFGGKARERRRLREEALLFFLELYLSGVPKVAVENPVGVVSSRFRKPDQIIQPWQFGEDASKATCLWLKDLPPLTPTQIVQKGLYSNQTIGGQDKRSGKKRSSDRSKTYWGIARAMAQQWGGLI